MALLAASRSSQVVGISAMPAWSSRSVLTNMVRADAISGRPYWVPSIEAFSLKESWKSSRVSAETTSSAG